MLAIVPAPAAAVTAKQVSIPDPFTDAASQHQTEVEPDSFAYGTMIVAAFQVGRFYNGGANAIGVATSTDGGASWTSKLLPGLTKATDPAAPFQRATDPSVAYDTVHHQWVISILGMRTVPPNPLTAVVAKTSPDGLDWSAAPVTVAPDLGIFAYDKNWTTCDNGAASPHQGNCYTSYTDFSNNRRVTTRTSSDGGQTWGAPKTSADASALGLGAVPVVQANGNLVIPFLGLDTTIDVLRSTDGGASFGSKTVVAMVTDHQPTGMRAPTLPSADVDGAGKVFVAWHDCRFRAGCPNGSPAPPNDIVFSTSSDAATWSAPARVPIDDVTSTVDHFIPGLAVDPATQGAAARLGLAYYFVSSTPCTVDTCRLNAGFIASSNGGATWRAPETLSTQPMALSWLASTDQGRMVGDYISTSFLGDGTAVPVLALAAPPDPGFHEAIFAAAFAPPTPPPPSPGTSSGKSSEATGQPATQAAVTIGASRRVVVFGQRLALFGAVSSRKGGETVEVVRRFHVQTRTDGSWLRFVRPGVSARFQARWSGVRSRVLSIGVRPRIELRPAGQSLRVRVRSLRSFAGKLVLLQQRGADGKWKTVQRARLGGGSAAVFDANLARGSRLRAVLPHSQVGPRYLAGISRELVIRA